MNRDNYQMLGKYIEQVDVRNRELRDLPLLGVSVEKKLIPSVANTNGTDFSSYKILSPNQFVYIADTSRRGDKIAFALNTSGNDAIISSAYTSFRIKDENELLPEYLMMWAKRPEFDRYARYMSHGSVRELFSWEEMCNVLLPVPPIAEQRRIVNEYQTVERRIRNNEALIQKLEETAQAIYYHTFVEGIDEENLPSGWRKGKLTDLIEIKSGGTPSTEINEFWGGEISLFSAMDINGNFCFDCIRKITPLGLRNCSSNLYEENTVILTARGTVGKLVLVGKPMAMNQSNFALLSKQKCQFFLYLYLKQYLQQLVGAANGAVFSAITLKDFDEDSIVPSVEAIKIAEKNFNPIFIYIKNLEQENLHLRTLLTLLTSKLS